MQIDFGPNILFQIRLFKEYYDSWLWSNAEFNPAPINVDKPKKLGFIICAYCETPKKYSMFFDLCKNLRAEYPSSMIAVASHLPVPLEIQEIVDITINDNDNTDRPHGIGEFKSIRQALFLLKDYNVDWVYKFNYDFRINKENKYVIDNWAKECKKRGKKLIGASWAMFAKPWSSFGIAAFYGEVEFLMRYFPKIYTRADWRRISDAMCEHVAWRAFSDQGVLGQIEILANYDDLFQKKKEMYIP